MIKKLKIFILGMKEFKNTLTTSFDYPEIEIYDKGRELMHKLTLRKFEQ